ncbi:MAG: hypothetical protein ACI9Z3_000082 [Roseivirga sp.]
MRALYLLLIYLTIYTGSISIPQNSINEFIGTWVYKTASYNFQTTFIEDTEGKLKAYSSVAAQNGNFLDTGEKESPNIEIGTFNKVTKELQIIINSTYSEASFKASLKLIDGEKMEFKLGEPIVDDIHYFPKEVTLHREISFEGEWEWEKNDDQGTFNLSLNQNLNEVAGQHSISAQSGRKSDCAGIFDENEVSVKGKAFGNLLTVTFKGSFSDAEGLAEIKYINTTQIEWKVIKEISGENYFPKKAVLKRNQ